MIEVMCRSSLKKLTGKHGLVASEICCSLGKLDLALLSSSSSSDAGLREALSESEQLF